MNEPDPTRVPRPWQPRYGLGLLFLVTVVVCVAAAGASYVVRGTRFHFLLFVLAAPLILTVGMSSFLLVLKWLNRRMR
jgi:hypothetical protein